MAVSATARLDSRQRITVIAGLLLFWMVLIVGRLTWVQVIHYGDWVQRAARQQQRTVEVSAQRGVIYDRNGQELAMTVPVDSVFAVPSEIPDQPSTVAILSKILNLDPQELLARLQSQRNFAWVARKIDADSAARIRSLNLRGVYFQKESKRFYPKRDLAAQVLGYVGMDDEGLAGIEHAYEEQLSGVKGSMMITMDARRKWFGRIEKEPAPGANIVLTIDEKIQYIAEKELEQAMEETHAATGTVVVQNPRTGEILALANRPTFNPNLSREISPDKLKNHAVSDVYEPGSVFKTVTYSSAFEEKLARPEEMVDCNPGFIMVGGIRIRDSHHIGYVSLERAYAESSDVGAVKMALRLGPDRFYKYMQAYGFGSPTGIELPGETKGLLKKPQRWSGSSIGSMSIGQEVGVTPLQIVSMMSSVANDGIYSQPRIVASVTAPKQGYQQIVFHPAGQHRVISSYTAALMRRLTEEVVLDGTARRAILDGYTSAGKTGTAQKIDPHTHAYSHTDYVASFVGFAPVNNPAVTIAVILDTPKGLHQGGQVSAPVFKRVAEQVLAYLSVPHDVEPRNDPMRKMLLAKAKERDIDEASDHQGGDTLEQVAQAEGVALPQSAPANSSGASGSIKAASLKLEQGPAPTGTAPSPMSGNPIPEGTVVLDGGSGIAVPSLLGMPLRSAIEVARKSGFELQVSGNGIARQQQPPPGSHVPPGSRIAVQFAR